MPPAPLRWLRIGGLVAWMLVSVPTAVQGVGQPSAFAVWIAGFLAFGAVFAWTTPRLSGPRPPVAAGLLVQAACVVVMTAAQCRGYEGTLLFLVAMQVGWSMPRRTGLIWVGAQTVVLTWAIQHHWSMRPALLLAPPYLGLQVLALLTLEVLGREMRSAADLARTNADLVSTRELFAQTVRLHERLRIARELHDAMGHHLAALSLNLEAVAQERGASPPLDTARLLTRRILDDVESVVDALAHDRGLDLGKALGALAAAIPRPLVHFEAPGLALDDPERAHTLLRCCQEIVTNSVKHSSAANLWISIRVAEGMVELHARDDGRGAARVGHGQGLTGMRRRLEESGGALDLETPPGGGFHVRARLPTGTAA